MKILVIQTSRFGDVLQTSAMLETLRQRYPRASITVLSRYRALDVLKDNSNIDYLELFDIENYADRLMNGSHRVVDLYEELKNAVEGLRAKQFDLVVNVTHDRFSTFLADLLHSPETRGMCLSTEAGLRVVVNGFWFRYLRCTSAFRRTTPFNLVDIYKNAVGGSEKVRNLNFVIPDDALLEAESLLQNEGVVDEDQFLVAFQLGTSTGKRCWPKESFAALGDMLNRKQNIKVVFLGSREEVELGDRVRDFMNTNPINLIGKTAIPALAGVLSKCALLVTNDTGTMHLASAVGTRCIALFFESANPYQTGPYGQGHIICCPTLDCFPCPTTINCKEKTCLQSIGVDRVYRLVQGMLNGRSFQADDIAENVRILETRFSKKGIWDAWPVDTVRLTKGEVIRRICRSMWLLDVENKTDYSNANRQDDLQEELKEELVLWGECYFEERELIQGWLDTFSDRLNGLEELVNKGVAILERIRTASSDVSMNRDVITAASQDVEVLDREIMEAGGSDQLLCHITHLFELELAQILNDDYFAMLSGWQKTYTQLNRRIELLKHQIRNIDEILIRDFTNGKRPHYICLHDRQKRRDAPAQVS